MKGYEGKIMKKVISILLVAALLCGGFAVASAGAAAAHSAQIEAQVQAIEPHNVIQNALFAQAMQALTVLLANTTLGEIPISMFVDTLLTLQRLGLDVDAFLAEVDHLLPMAVRAALHDAGLINIPIWERDPLMHFIFYWILFGWLWM